MLSEVEYNSAIVAEERIIRTPLLHDDQFRRSIGANALAALDDATRTAVMHAYLGISAINRLIDKTTHTTPEEARGA